ncbi:cation diffusion facilitator family transporter [Candidatus Saccharibacteria bacterium]|nr:cation diffusion facilitator family transporter [Candidatus Saccharibacteria bacterium]
MKLTRSKTVIKSGFIFILTNFLLAILNIIVGLASNSIAIASDATHSLIDSISGFLVIISEKLANHKKFNAKREQIERITTIIIALVIITTGLELLILSIKNIFDPEDVDYSAPVMIILIISLFIKYGLAIYLKKTGKKIKSQVVVASGAETMNDCWISISVLFSAIIYLIWHINIESYISIIISIVIIIIGLEFIFPHIFKHHHHHLESDPDHDHCGKQ